LDPVWNEANVCTFSANSCKGKVLEVECWDYDVIPPDEFMGRITIPVDSLEVGRVYKQLYKLEKGIEKGKSVTVRGHLMLAIEKKQK